MTENDDLLIQQFLAPGRADIADNGFPPRVVRSLPRRNNLVSCLWTGFCCSLAVLLFVLLDGWGLITNALREIFDAMWQNGTAEMDLKSLAIAGAVLLCLVYRKVATLE